MPRFPFCRSDQQISWEIADWGAKVTLIDRPAGSFVIFDDGSAFEIALSQSN
jgi:ethanolamine utilization microcompartment shell protein EutS